MGVSLIRGDNIKQWQNDHVDNQKDSTLSENKLKIAQAVGKHGGGIRKTSCQSWCLCNGNTAALYCSCPAPCSWKPHLFAALKPQFRQSRNLPEKLKLEARAHKCATQFSHELKPSCLFWLPSLSLAFAYFTPNYAVLRLELSATVINSQIT